MKPDGDTIRRAGKAGKPAKVRVLVVEDSATVSQLLVQIFEAWPETEVVGIARNGQEAVEATDRLMPDVITMDINMPKLNGFEATRAIMQRRPTPIVIVSGTWNPSEVRTTFKALESGALAVLAHPPDRGSPSFESAARELVTTVRLMSEVKVVRRWSRSADEPAGDGGSRAAASLKGTSRQIDVVAIGASTGGPPALHTILSGLPPGLPFPILIVQHLAHGFMAGFIEWLQQASNFPAQEAAHGELAIAGRAYIAPDDFHLGIDECRRLLLSKEVPDAGHRPSVDHLFRSVTASYGPRSAGVLLTGMGVDGAVALKKMRAAGAMTVAQDKATSVIYGMPGEAARIEASMWNLPIESIADFIASLGSEDHKHPFRAN